MYELLSGNRRDLIPLNFPGGGEPDSVQTQGFFYETIVFGALFCAVVDYALMRFLFYVSSPGSPCLTNLRGNNTRNFLPSEHVKGPDFPIPTVGYMISVLTKIWPLM